MPSKLNNPKMIGRGENPPKPVTSVHRYSSDATVTITAILLDSPCYDFDAQISPRAVVRVAKAAGIGGKDLAEWLRLLLVNVAVVEQDQSQRTTRRKLEVELRRLAKLGSESRPPPKVSEAVEFDFDRFFIGRALLPRFGSSPCTVAIEEIEDWRAIVSTTRRQLDLALDDPAEVAQLARKRLRSLRDVPLTKYEERTRRSAFKRVTQYVADAVLGFWIQSGHSVSVTNQLIYFSDEVYRVVGIRMDKSAVRRQLHHAVVRRAEDT